MPAPEQVVELLKRFKDNIEAYKSGNYNETQVRVEFIDPFFEALGWDVKNKKGYAEAYKDVIHEDANKIGGFTKAPDYCFRVGGIRKFFLEAKKPSINIKEDIHPVYQLRRYAWSAKLPLSILTDFEELAVYDCRIKPVKTDKASTARVPDYQSVMLPFLKFVADGKEYAFRETIEGLAQTFKITDEERRVMLPSGGQALFDNRIGWARTYLKKAGLLMSERRGYFSITERGKNVLKENIGRIDVAFLKQYPEFVEFQKPRKNNEEKTELSADISPGETLENAYKELQDGLAAELLQTIKSCSPEFFEHLVIDVLIRMGYGGSRKEAGNAMGRSGDGGIDGIIKEDKLGLDIIYIQAKRWEGTVGRPEIQKFAGALQGQRAKKGIFITTSSFSNDALEYVKNIENKIILIDGIQLAELMIDHNVGISPIASYEIKKIDSDYFIEE